MQTRRIHLINPKIRSLTTRPIYFGKALYSPLAGLLSVGALIPRDQYEVVLTDENVEPIDFDLKVDLVGISAMTTYVKRGYEIAAAFRSRGVPVVMGGVHPSFMPKEALRHADAVVVGEAELVMERLLGDLRKGELKGLYKGERLHPLMGLPRPRYDLIKKNHYVNRTFIQTSRGCHHACTFCSEHMMNGLRFRYRPIEEVIGEIESCGEKVIVLNDADFFGSPAHAIKLMKALKGRGIRWQAGVNSRDAFNDELLELAAESGCYMLNVGLESISRESLKGVHKYQNRPENFETLAKKIQGHGILVFGLFMFGFDQDDPSVFEQTVEFNIQAGFDVCAYSLVTPFPGTLFWFEMLRDGRVVSYDWDKYDQGHLVFSPLNLKPDEVREGYQWAYTRFYSIPSMFRRFPATASRSTFYWMVYNTWFRKGKTERLKSDVVAESTAASLDWAVPPIMPERKEWEKLVREGGC